LYRVVFQEKVFWTMSLESIALSRTGPQPDGHSTSEVAGHHRTPVRGILFGLLFSVPLWGLIFYLFR